MDALPAEGPEAPFMDRFEVERRQKQAEIEQLEKELEITHVPADPIATGMRLGDALTTATRKWASVCIREGSDQVPDLVDWWIRLLAVLGDDYDEWAAHIFLQWGQHVLPDIIAEQMDGVVEGILDSQFAELAAILPRTERMARLAQARHRVQMLCEAEEAPDLPHRPVRRGAANPKERNATCQRVPSAFLEHPKWHQAFRRLRWLDLPAWKPIPALPGDGPMPTLLVVHLFSGRRRLGDFHWQMQKMAIQAGVQLQIVSMDTAVSAHWGDLWHTSESWNMLEQLYQLGGKSM